MIAPELPFHWLRWFVTASNTPRAISTPSASGAPIIIGGIAGWLAEQFMKSQMGLVMNIVLGIVGAAVASWLLGFLGISLGGWIGYLIAGFIGACILIAIARAFRGGLQRT